jgi:hypothetical protein
MNSVAWYKNAAWSTNGNGIGKSIAKDSQPGPESGYRDECSVKWQSGEILNTISHTFVRECGSRRNSCIDHGNDVRQVLALIVFLIVAMYFLNRSYMMRFFNPGTRSLGIPILIAGAFMIAIGYWLMTKIADIEV